MVKNCTLKPDRISFSAFFFYSSLAVPLFTFVFTEQSPSPAAASDSAHPAPISPISHMWAHVRSTGRRHQLLLPVLSSQESKKFSKHSLFSVNHVHNPLFLNSCACKQLTEVLPHYFSKEEKSKKESQPDLSSLDPFTCLFESEGDVCIFPSGNSRSCHSHSDIGQCPQSAVLCCLVDF